MCDLAVFACWVFVFVLGCGMCHKKLFVKADGQEDCHVISTLLQDSIFHKTSHSFHADKGCFRMLLNRFCWETPADSLEGDKTFFRVHSGLFIYGVQSMVANNNFRDDGGHKFLNLLAIQLKGSDVALLFSGNKHLRVRVEKPQIYLKDLHEAYPTLAIPDHRLS
jgi:hypothetical protein